MLLPPLRALTTLLVARCHSTYYRHALFSSPPRLSRAWWTAVVS